MKDHDTAGPGRNADLADRDSVSDGWGRAAAYDAYADGLHTYALGGLRNHEAAASAVYCAFVAADHHVAHLSDAEVLRPWLYAITRHYCRQGKLPRLGLTPTAASWDPGESGAQALAGLERSLLAAELASLDWPDTDGMQTAHREVLELSVRHGLESRAVGLMLACPAEESFELLSQAWTELERSLAATAVLRTTREHCAQLAALAAEWTGRLTARTREPLVSHVDACSHCQYYLHTVIGTPQAPTILPHVAAPRALRARVLGDLLDTGPARAAAKGAIAGRLVAFDQWGFPAVGGAGVRPGEGSGEPETGDGSGAAGAAGSATSAKSATSATSRHRADGRGSGPVPRDASLPAEAIATALESPSTRSSRRAADASATDRSGRRARPTSATPSAGPTNRRSTHGSVGSMPMESGAGFGDRHAATGSFRALSTDLSATSEGRRASRLAAQDVSAPAAEAAAGERRKANRHRRSGFRTLGGSVMLSGAGAAGLTAFVVLASSGPSHTTLFADPESGAAQGPDAAQQAGPQGGEPIPVSGGGTVGDLPTAQTGGNPGPVTAQIVAAVVTTAPSGAPGGVAARSGTETGSSAAGHLSVTVDQRAGDPSQVTVTLGDAGTAPVAWTATPDAGYLRLSSSSGVVRPGTQQSVTIDVDQAAAPATAWQAHVRFDPGGSTVVVRGTGNAPATSSAPGAKPSSPSLPSSDPGSGPTGPAPSSSPSATGSPTSSSTSPSTTPTTGPSPTATTTSPAPTSAERSATSAPASATPSPTAHSSAPTAAPTGSASTDRATTPSPAAPGRRR